jgi:aminopeptidase N
MRNEQMTPSLSYDELIALDPCDASSRKYLFKNAERLTARDALAAGASLSDLVWVAGSLGLRRQCVQFALACAQRAAHLNTNPRVQAALDAVQTWLDNPSDLNAANAARAIYATNDGAVYASVYAANPAATYAASAAANYAAAAAHAAAYAANYAASAAANAANAAVYAANAAAHANAAAAATYAAGAAANAANAAAYAARAATSASKAAAAAFNAEREEQKKLFLQIFEKPTRRLPQEPLQGE